MVEHQYLVTHTFCLTNCKTFHIRMQFCVPCLAVIQVLVPPYALPDLKYKLGKGINTRPVKLLF